MEQVNSDDRDNRHNKEAAQHEHRPLPNSFTARGRLSITRLKVAGRNGSSRCQDHHDAVEKETTPRAVSGSIGDLLLTALWTIHSRQPSHLAGPETVGT